MVVGIEAGNVVFAVFEHYENGVAVVELAKQPSVLIVVESVYIGVEPHLAPSESGVAVALQSDSVNLFLGKNVALRRASLYDNLGEVAVEEYA